MTSSNESRLGDPLELGDPPLGQPLSSSPADYGCELAIFGY